MKEKIQLKKLGCILLCAFFVAGFSACQNMPEGQEKSTISTSSSSAPFNEEESSSQSSTSQFSASSILSPENRQGEGNSVRAVQGTVNSKAEIVKIYAEAYNKTKASGSLAGTDSISLLSGTLKLNGSVNSAVETLINKNITKIFGRGNTVELPPAGASYQTCVLREEDVKAASLREDDTAITLKIVPRDDVFPMRGQGGSGNFTEVVSVETVKDLAAGQGVTFSGGKAFDDCVKLEYMGTESTIQIDKASGLITSAVYQSLYYVQAEQVSVAWFQNQSASTTVCYKMEFPGK